MLRYELGVLVRSPSRSPALGRASHGDTKTRRKVPARNADVLVGIIASLRFQVCLVSAVAHPGLHICLSLDQCDIARVFSLRSIMSPFGLLLCSLPRKSPSCLVPSQRPLACVQVSGFRFASFAPAHLALRAACGRLPSQRPLTCVLRCAPVSGLQFHASGFTLPVSGLRFHASGFTLQVSAFSFLPHVCRIQSYRSRSGYRHGFQRSLDLCAGVFYYREAFLKCLNT